MPLSAIFTPAVVGLDLGSHTVRAVALRQTRRGWRLLAAGEAPAVDDGAGAAAGVLAALGFRRVRVVAALPTHAAIIKRLTLPPMSSAELADSLPVHAAHHLPFAGAEVRLDYHLLDGAKALPVDALEILLVAARTDRIDERVSAVRASGHTPVVLDVEAFALANAYELNYPDQLDGLVVLAHVGQRSTLVCLLERGQLVSTRDIQIGGRAYGDALGRDGSPDSRADDGAEAIRDLHHQLTAELRRTLDFHRAASPFGRVERVVLSGGACGIEGLRAALAADLDTDVDVADPFRRITRIARMRNAEGHEAQGPGYAVAVGLALRREHDR